MAGVQDARWKAIDDIHARVFGSTWWRNPPVVVSVGKRDLPVQQSSNGVPQVVQRVVRPSTSPLPAPIDRRDKPPTRKGIPMSLKVFSIPGGKFRVITPDGVVHNDLTRGQADALGKKWAPGTPEYKGGGNLTIPRGPMQGGNTPVSAGPILTGPMQTMTGPTGRGETMDLGALITDLGTQYIRTRYAPQPTVQPVLNAPFIPDAVEQFAPWYEDGSGNLVAMPQKKRCRRRRRRLATKSDLGDLAALKAILGNGEAFKAWIATHSR